jgi:methylthioribose-1-phosphate isomerase
MKIPTVIWGEGGVEIIDQTLLPGEYRVMKIRNKEEMWEAIRSLRVRGAPAIGIAAAMAVAFEMLGSKASDYQAFSREVEETAAYLATSRPTAVNLFWALERMKQTARENSARPLAELKEILVEEARKILAEDEAMCRAIGEAGSTLIKDGDGILTHCNAGGLATSGFGTALAPIYVAFEEGRKIRVFSDETRPLLQGARLTMWELMEVGVDATMICDNMAAVVMKEGKIDLVITGADRVAANGDAANKIGTYGVARLARAHDIPFYMAWPASTLDLSLSSGDEIPIEERGKEELVSFGGRMIAPEGAKTYSPAFDVTPHELITAFITDRGLIHPPYEQNLKVFAGDR